MKLYEEITNFIAKTAGPEKLAAFRPSKAASRKVELLVQKTKMVSSQKQSGPSLTTACKSNT